MTIRDAAPESYQVRPESLETFSTRIQHMVNEKGPEQSMKIDDRKINRSIDDNRLITVD